VVGIDLSVCDLLAMLSYTVGGLRQEIKWLYAACNKCIHIVAMQFIYVWRACIHNGNRNPGITSALEAGNGVHINEFSFSFEIHFERNGAD